jgi:hypothetical protein
MFLRDVGLSPNYNPEAHILHSHRRENLKSSSSRTDTPPFGFHFPLPCSPTLSGASSLTTQVKVTLQLTVRQSVCLGVEPHLGLMIRYYIQFDCYCLVLALSDARTGLSFVRVIVSSNMSVARKYNIPTFYMFYMLFHCERTAEYKSLFQRFTSCQRSACATRATKKHLSPEAKLPGHEADHSPPPYLLVLN